MCFYGLLALCQYVFLNTTAHTITSIRKQLSLTSICLILIEIISVFYFTKQIFRSPNCSDELHNVMDSVLWGFGITLLKKKK